MKYLLFISFNICLGYPKEHTYWDHSFDEERSVSMEECLRTWVKVFSINPEFRILRLTGIKWPLSKRLKICFQDQLLLNADQKYCRMLQWEHSAIL